MKFNKLLADSKRAIP